MNGLPRISVVTPCLNAVRWIGDNLHSVSFQDGISVEHLVSDGGSTDGTLAILQRQGQMCRLLTGPDKGPYDAMNKGIAAATGDILGVLNSDDVYADSAVLADVARTFADPNVQVCYGNLVFVQAEDTTKVFRYWRSEPYRVGLFEGAWAPPHPTFFVRRELFGKFGGFDLQYKISADFDLMCRFLFRYQLHSVYLPRVMVRMRFGGISTGSTWNRIKQNLEVYRSCRANGVSVPPFPLFMGRKILRRGSQYFEHADQERGGNS